MSQYCRPGYDLTTGSWVTAPLCSKLEEYPADDSTFIQGPSSGGSTCELLFFACDDPEVSWGHEVGYRYCRKGAGTGSLNLTVKLLCGLTEIASWTHTNIGASVVEAIQPLSAVQADAITDYGDVRIRFTQTTASGSGYSAAVTWCYFDCPEIGATGPVSVSPPTRAAAGAKVDPRVVLGSLQLSPSPALAPCESQVYAVLSPAEVTLSPGNPAAARCAAAYQLLIVPHPVAAKTGTLDPTLILSSFACAPGSPAAAGAARTAPETLVINAVVVELSLKGRTISDLALGERPGVYLVERLALEDGTGHWLFEDGGGIELGTGLAGTQFNLRPRPLSLVIIEGRNT